MPTAISEFTGEPVSTDSEDWRHECEVRWLLSLPDRFARNDYLNGYVAENGRRMPGIVGHRGQAAADRLRKDAEKLFYLRRERAKAAAAPAPDQPSLL